LTRANLSKNWRYYFQILNKRTQLRTINVDGTAEIDYERIANNPFSTHIINFGNTDSSYRDFLQAAIPRSVSIIRMMKENIARYNFHDMLAEYEPFLIYRDNLTYSGRVYGERSTGQGGPYQEIRTHIIRKMKEYNSRYAIKRREYGELASIKSAKQDDNVLFPDIKNAIVLQSIRKYYQIDENMPIDEMLNHIIATDNATAYMSLLASPKRKRHSPIPSRVSRVSLPRNTCLNRRLKKTTARMTSILTATTTKRPTICWINTAMPRKNAPPTIFSAISAWFSPLNTARVPIWRTKWRGPLLPNARRCPTAITRF